MQILVTGAAGFIGSHLSEKLLLLGHKVTGIDNFDPFYDRNIKESNLEKCLSTENFTFYNSDISDINTTPVLNSLQPDIVIHLAAKAGIRPSIENPGAYIQTNILGTFHLLEWMKTTGCRKLVFASSSSVYGNNRKTPFEESDPVDSPISPYAYTKKSCELLNFNYHHLYDMSIINLRFFTVYGPRQRPDLAIHKFFSLIYNNKPLDIFGDGTTGRDYTYIDDIINGIYSSVSRIKNSNKLFEIINLGNNKPVLLKDLIDTIENITGKKIIRRYLPMQPGDVDHTYADITEAKNKLNFQPATTLREGLSKFKSWYESR